MGTQTDTPPLARRTGGGRAGSRRRFGSPAARAALRAYAPVVVLLALGLLIALLNPNFLEWRNLVRLANAASVPLTIAMGTTFIILLGSIDLSAEGGVAIAATVLVLLARNDANTHDAGWLAVPAAILASGLMGLISGAVQTGLRIPSFMATLGTWFVGLGVSTYLLGGSAVRLLDPALRGLALDRVAGLPLAVWIALAAFGIALVVQTQTRLGRHILAIGGGEDLAELSGVRPVRVRLLAFTMAGLFYGVAGVLAAAQLGQSNAVIGDGRLFAAVTAVVVGGTALTGGEGGVFNTLIGVLIVTVLGNGMVLLGISPYIQQTVQGLMIIAAVALSLDRLRQKIVKLGAAMLAAQSISKGFLGVQALKDVSITVRQNEVVGLIGENGAGKSTLMRTLSGTVRPDSGTLTLDGQPLKLRSTRDAATAGIGMVFQEQSLLLNLTVAENIYLGDEQQFTRLGLVNWRAMRAAARRQLDKIGVDIDVKARTSELTFAARQMVELAKALTLEDSVSRPLTILLDEPTSVLSRADIDVLFTRVRSLKQRASFVFVSHRLDEVLQLSDRVYVMKDGQVVAEHRAADVTAPELHEIMVGRSFHTGYYKEARQAPPRDEVLLELSGFAVGDNCRDIDLTLHAGEVLGIAGVVGSGREEVTRAVGGFLPQTAGRLKIAGQTVQLTGPEQAVRLGIGTVPRERRVEGLVMFLSIAQNITLASLDGVMRAGMIDHGRERAVAAEWVKRLRIKAPNVDVACRKLSGGNQQKVVLARWMTAASRILILDHPTRGLDVGAKEEVYELVRDLSAQGIGILLLSDTLEETIGLCHRVLVMRDGEITAHFDAAPGAKPDQVDLVRAMV